MGRAQRIDVEGGWYHVMNRGVSRQAVFFDDRDRIEFGRLLNQAFERFGVEVVAYCLMTNHYHLVLHCPKARLSDAMHLIGSVYTRHANDRTGRDGPLFRGRFHAVPILNDEQLLCTVRYVHRNALDLPGVGSVAGYRWSSHRTYMGHRVQPPFLVLEPVLGQFKDRTAFDAFVTGAVSKPLGDGIAVERIAPLVQLVAEEVGSGEFQGSRSARSLVLLLADRLPERVGDELRVGLSFATRKSLRQARARANRLFDAEPEVARIVERTLELVA